MPNDVSYFKVEGDNTKYAFNDLDLEERVTQLASDLAEETERATDAEEANAEVASVLADALTFSSVNDFDSMLFAIAPTGKPYIRWNKSDGTKYQISMNNTSYAPRTEFFDGTSWSIMFDPTGTVTVARGGTGATTAAGARANLGLLYTSGETFTQAAQTAFAGVVTGGSQTIYLNVPVDKLLDNINSISVTSLTGGIRAVNGNYINGVLDTVEWVGQSGITVSALKASSRMVRVTITSTSAFTSGGSTVTNNTPVTLVGTVTLSFT